MQANEFTIEKNNYVAEEKIKITENFKNELGNQEVRLKIEKSKQQNASRIERMKKVNEIVEDLKNELKAKVRGSMKSDTNAYKGLLKNLLIQVCIFILQRNIDFCFILGSCQAHGRSNLHQMQRG